MLFRAMFILHFTCSLLMRPSCAAVQLCSLCTAQFRGALVLRQPCERSPPKSCPAPTPSDPIPPWPLTPGSLSFSWLCLYTPGISPDSLVEILAFSHVLALSFLLAPGLQHSSGMVLTLPHLAVGHSDLRMVQSHGWAPKVSSKLV